jgi:hypothetical protein
MDLSEVASRWHGIHVERLADGRHRVAVAPEHACAGASMSWTTAYPPELILEIHAEKRGFVCDEIRRDEIRAMSSAPSGTRCLRTSTRKPSAASASSTSAAARALRRSS